MAKYIFIDSRLSLIFNTLQVSRAKALLYSIVKVICVKIWKHQILLNVPIFKTTAEP